MPVHLDHLWNVERLIEETFVQSVEVHPRLGSTNDRALQLAGESGRSACLIIAEEQTSGRGRGANRWWSAAGSVSCSLLLRPDHSRLPVFRWPQISMTVGSAMCETISDRLPAADVRLKWPNDVYLMVGAGESSVESPVSSERRATPLSTGHWTLNSQLVSSHRKVCGILVEIPPQHSDQLIIGVGLNANNPSSAAPAELQQMLISLCDVAGEQLDRAELLREFLQHLERQLLSLSEAPESVVQRWRHYDLLSGRCVTIDSGDRRVTGTCAGIDDDGALLLRTEAGLSRFYGGVVTCW